MFYEAGQFLWRHKALISYSTACVANAVSYVVANNKQVAYTKALMESLSADNRELVLAQQKRSADACWLSGAAACVFAASVWRKMYALPSDFEGNLVSDLLALASTVANVASAAYLSHKTTQQKKINSGRLASVRVVAE